MNQKPATQTYVVWLSTMLSNYEKLARSAVPHHGEKGRVVEGAVKSALRAILPSRFSIGTGFIISSSARTSTQLDLVIYDSFYNAPLILEGGVGLFPIECVYGFVEVKSNLRAEDIDQFASVIRTVREMAEDKRYVMYQRRQIAKGKFVSEEVENKLPLSPRAFAFCVNSSLPTIARLEDKVTSSVTQHRAHIHALAVLKKNWLLSQLPYQNSPRFQVTNGRAFENFCISVLRSVQSVEMYPASMGRYIGAD